MKYKKQIEELKEHLFITTALSVYQCDFEDLNEDASNFIFNLKLDPKAIRNFLVQEYSWEKLLNISLLEFFELLINTKVTHIPEMLNKYSFTIGNIIYLHKLCTRTTGIRKRK